MKSEDRIQHLKYLMDRFDKFLQVIDSKGNILIAYHFFVIGGLLINYESLNDIFQSGILTFKLVVYLASVVSIASLVLIFRSLHPFLKKGAYVDTDSLIFFKSVSDKKFERFSSGIKGLTLVELENDFTEQTHTLAKGLNRKFLLIKWAGGLCFIHLIIALACLIQQI